MTSKTAKEALGMIGVALSLSENYVPTDDKEEPLTEAELIAMAEAEQAKLESRYRNRGMKFYEMSNGQSGWALNDKNAVRKYGGSITNIK